MTAPAKTITLAEAKEREAKNIVITTDFQPHFFGWAVTI